MTIQTLSRYGFALFLVALVSGCSLWGGDDASTETSYAERPSECRWSRSSCMYNGKYESGERDYAEEEAARLNKASLARLRGR